MYIKWSIMFMLCILVCGFRLTHPNFHVTLICLWHHLRPPSLKLGISLGHPWRWVEYPLFCGYLVHGACLCIMAYSPNVGTRRFAHYRPFILYPLAFQPAQGSISWVLSFDACATVACFPEMVCSTLCEVTHRRQCIVHSLLHVN